MTDTDVGGKLVQRTNASGQDRSVNGSVRSEHTMRTSDAAHTSARTREALLEIDEVTHEFGGVRALDEVSMAIEGGEFLTLLGPSGCGKTTLLRCIAGFVQPTRGRVLLGGRDITRDRPNKRPINMVFQRPTLFPHLDVFGNVAFGLRLERVGKRETAQRVSDALALVQLGGFERRRPTEMSGGQMQRVSLARALVKRPLVLLLDEPLSALDLRIRLEMEVELRRVHRETGATFIYVTHDQREALALSDRIALLDHGRVEQIGRPEDVYRLPESPFAARFVGNANVIPATVLSLGDGRAVVDVGGTTLGVDGELLTEPGPIWLVVRAETVSLSESPGALAGTVRDIAYRGTGYSYRIEVEGLPDLVTAEVRGSITNAVGETASVSWDWSSVAVLPRQSR